MTPGDPRWAEGYERIARVMGITANGARNNASVATAALRKRFRIETLIEAVAACFLRPPTERSVAVECPYEDRPSWCHHALGIDTGPPVAERRFPIPHARLCRSDDA